MHSPAHKAEFPNAILLYGRKLPPSFLTGGDHAGHYHGYLAITFPRSIKCPLNDRRSLNLQLTMDPISFSASLVTLGGLVAALLERLHTFENLLSETNKQLQTYWGHAQSQELLQHVWGDSVAQMQRDIQILHRVLNKVESLVSRRSWRSKALLLVRQILDEEKIALYQSQLTAHCGTLTNMQALISG